MTNQNKVDREVFNSYCAEVMGYESYCDEPYPFDVWEYRLNEKMVYLQDNYNPFDDLNQSAPVAIILMAEKGLHLTLIEEEPIQNQINDFIISTMPKEKE